MLKWKCIENTHKQYRVHKQICPTWLELNKASSVKTSYWLCAGITKLKMDFRVIINKGMIAGGSYVVWYCVILFFILSHFFLCLTSSQSTINFWGKGFLWGAILRTQIFLQPAFYTHIGKKEPLWQYDNRSLLCFNSIKIGVFDFIWKSRLWNSSLGTCTLIEVMQFKVPFCFL